MQPRMDQKQQPQRSSIQPREKLALISHTGAGVAGDNMHGQKQCETRAAVRVGSHYCFQHPFHHGLGDTSLN